MCAVSLSWCGNPVSLLSKLFPPAALWLTPHLLFPATFPPPPILLHLVLPVSCISDPRYRLRRSPSIFSLDRSYCILQLYQSLLYIDMTSQFVQSDPSTFLSPSLSGYSRGITGERSIPAQTSVSLNVAPWGISCRRVLVVDDQWHWRVSSPLPVEHRDSRVPSILLPHPHASRRSPVAVPAAAGSASVATLFPEISICSLGPCPLNFPLLLWPSTVSRAVPRLSP